jgi:hypothetical protein
LQFGQIDKPGMTNFLAHLLLPVRAFECFFFGCAAINLHIIIFVEA